MLCLIGFIVLGDDLRRGLVCTTRSVISSIRFDSLNLDILLRALETTLFNAGLVITQFQIRYAFLFLLSAQTIKMIQ